MIRDKIVRKVGTSIGIIFNKEEAEIIGIEEGDVLTLEIKHAETSTPLKTRKDPEAAK